MLPSKQRVAAPRPAGALSAMATDLPTSQGGGPATGAWAFPPRAWTPTYSLAVALTQQTAMHWHVACATALQAFNVGLFAPIARASTQV
jgi:hypothetical protein